MLWLSGDTRYDRAMAESPFVHLHVHTHYSLLDGANKVGPLVRRAKELGMDSLAITDHGCMFGVVEFFNECKKEGIKPILGMEAYMAPGDRRERSTPGGNAGEAAYHLLLLAENLQGYKNLMRLSSIAYREGFYYKPRIDKEVLRELSDGLIATSACLGGEIPSAFMKRDAKTARRIAETYLELFKPDRFFIEIQKQGLREQDEINPELVDLAGKLGCGIVATNDVHFLRKEDHYAHDVLCCISMNRQVSDENRLKYPTELYLKSPEEMRQALGAWPEALANTARIAEMCRVDLDFSKRYAPVYRVPAEKLRDDLTLPSAPRAAAEMPADERYLRELCETGLEWRYGTRKVEPEVRQRLEHELKIICMKNFCSYFLIVWDFCNYARDNQIPVGARGSGVGTMVGYLLGLCNVDPLKYGLLFERFMDPSRNEMPDIDIDICQDGRQKVIEYVRQKYGHVAQIITFGTLAAKAACKDVGRVLGVPLAEIDKLTKLIPGTPGMTLDKALASTPELNQLYKSNPLIQNVIDTARKLEGMCRNAGCHAAGVIIADQPLDTLVPLYRDSDGNILTQFEGPIAEKCGLLKMDFLGLRTLSTLMRSIELVKQTRGIEIDIENIDLADPKVLALFQRGETKGIFQFESGGMQDLLMKMRPDRVEDLIAANALYRPGPMELIPLYCNRKHGREAVPKVHPIMDEILAETYSIMVYQEQVMRIFNQLGGIELSNAYKLIKAISKKTTDVIAKFKPDFIKGTMEKGVSREKAEEIFDLILKFGGYGFNKSHSTRYAIVAYQTAYMKAYYPVEYMAALLTYEMGSTEKVVEYIDECRRMVLPDGMRGIKVLPPDVNLSDKNFTPVFVGKAAAKPRSRKGAKARSAAEAAGAAGAGGAAGSMGAGEWQIRFGLLAIRGVGEKAVESILAERKSRGEFRGLYDFTERVDQRTVTRSTIEAMIKCGAFSSLGARRSQLIAIVDKAIELGQQSQRDQRMGQMNMFAASPSAAAAVASHDALPDLQELSNAELLKFEKEFLGFYITSHPLTEHQAAIERYTTASTREVQAMGEGAEVTIGGMIGRLKKSVTKSGRSAGQPMAILTLEDLDGSIDAMVFSETLADLTQRHPGAIANENIVFVKGKIDKRRENACLIVNDLTPVESAVEKLTTSVGIKLDRARHGPDTLESIRAILQRYRGPREVYVQVSLTSGKKVSMRLDRDRGVRPTSGLVEDLEQALGGGAVQLSGDGARRQRRLAIQQTPLFQDASAPEPADAASVEPGDELLLAAEID